MATEKSLKIRSVPPSFRRAGLSFTAKETTLSVSELSEDQIKALKSEPNLVVVEVDQPVNDAPGDQDTDDAKLATLVHLIGQIDVDDKPMWTNGGKPQTAALEDMHGGTVTAKERDAAWQLYQDQQGNGAE